MLTFYLTISILLLFISIILCIMFMNEMVVNKSAGNETFDFFGVEIEVPEDSADFMAITVIMAIICWVVILFWPLAMPILIYWCKFMHIRQKEP